MAKPKTKKKSVTSTKKTTTPKTPTKPAEPAATRYDPFANPFPHPTPKGAVIVDEECGCGARRTEHGPGRFGAFGHGACERTGCKQFTWVKMIYGEPSK